MESSTNKKNETQSPLKVVPLRTAGQSLGEQIDDLLYTSIFTWFMAAAIALVFAGMEWVAAEITMHLRGFGEGQKFLKEGYLLDSSWPYR